MAAAAAPQEGQSFKNVDVRKATNADTADIIAAVAEGYKASIRPIFLAALKGIGIHLRSIAFAGAACALGAYLGLKEPEHLVAAGTLGWAGTWCLLLIYIWLQMMKELTTAATGDLADIEKHFLSDQKGSSFWVVVRAAETAVSQGAGSQTLQESEQVVGCVGLKATSRGDARVLHLAVVPRDQGHGMGSALLKHVIKHAKAQGLQTLTATCHSGQPAAVHVLGKLGFKEVVCTQVHKWFTVYTLRLTLADKQH